MSEASTISIKLIRENEDGSHSEVSESEIGLSDLSKKGGGTYYAWMNMKSGSVVEVDGMPCGVLASHSSYSMSGRVRHNVILKILTEDEISMINNMQQEMMSEMRARRSGIQVAKAGSNHVTNILGCPGRENG